MCATRASDGIDIAYPTFGEGESEFALVPGCFRDEAREVLSARLALDFGSFGW